MSPDKKKFFNDISQSLVEIPTACPKARMSHKQINGVHLSTLRISIEEGDIDVTATDACTQVNEVCESCELTRGFLSVSIVTETPKTGDKSKSVKVHPIHS